MEDKIIISAKDVCFEYEDDPGSRALKGVSLDIERGSFVAILGHNGSGKSTFAKLVNGILTPTSGKVLVNGLDTSDENNLIEIRRKVGMVFQNPDNQIVGSVVEEDVAFGPENLGVEPAEIRRRVDEALATVGMSDFKLHAPGKLSGGQKQRVAIAGILAMMPQCIVLDESTAMLDPAGRQEIIATVEKLNKERNITVLLITHYMNEAAKADRVVVMNDGKVLCDGTPKEVFSRVELLESVGLDVPGPTKLLYMLKKDERFSSLPEGVVDEDEAAELISKVLKGRNKS